MTEAESSPTNKNVLAEKVAPRAMACLTAIVASKNRSALFFLFSVLTNGIRRILNSMLWKLQAIKHRPLYGRCETKGS